MSPKISYIHDNKLGKWNQQYLDKDGTVYIGQKDGRLKKKELSLDEVQSAITSATNRLANSLTPSTNKVTGRTGDINVVTSGSNYEVQNAVMPFLLMGC